MNTSNQQYESVETYIAQAPKEVQPILLDIRKTIKDAVPSAVESIAYGMPAYKVNKKPVGYFAAFAHHIGFYATPHGNEAFQDRLAPYKQGKGSIQFPLDQPIPLELIKDMVKYNAERLGA